MLKPVVGASPGGRTPFVKLLVQAGLASASAVELAEQQASSDRVDLAEAIVALGLAPEPDVYDCLALAAGTKFVRLDELPAPGLALTLVPERVARRHIVVPVSVDNRVLVYATCRPFDSDADGDLRFASGRTPKAVVATRSQLVEAIDRLYPKLNALDSLANRLRTDAPVVEDSVVAAGESVVVDLCNLLIGHAVEHGASDVHIDSTHDGGTVRFRTCGILEKVMTIPAAASQPVCNRFKVMARADISIKLRPQDGAFRLKVNSRVIDVRLSTLPTVDGEKIVMRVIDAQSPLQSLDRLGYDDETLDRLKKCLARPDGLVLTTGPTGSGKTTALYAALAHLRTGKTNIVSVEDPVERTVPGVTQIAVNAKTGNTFPAVLRSLLRQDPNILMVGEVRDGEVAQIVGQAAYTGHLVLTSLHTADAASAITRLMNLGLEPFKVAESLSAVLAQRLVRRLCPHCSVPTSEFELRRLRSAGQDSAPSTVGPGCPRCKHTGYLGRLPVAELLTPTDALRATIARGATAHEVRQAMNASGMRTMRERALDLVSAGLTSIEEVDRVLAAADEGSVAKRSRLRVLVADDDQIIRMLVRVLLERADYDVIEAANGRHAVELASRERPDLLLVDLNMPEMDGYQAIGEMRNRLALATMPIMVLTAEEGPGVERRVFELGADDYLVKPFDAEVLLSRVHALFRRLKHAAA